ncbi:MAG: FtsK/SpoIIIE family DNA translocase [Pirellulaceae bacterium]
MTDKGNRNLRLDLLALGLLALVIFLTLALLTYSPADPLGELVAPLNSLYQPDVLVFPQNAVVENACGKRGALMASMLLTGLGLGAYYLVVSLATLDALLLLRREIDAPVVRAFGWCASLLGLTTIAALAVPNWSPGPVIGSGGYLGALGAALLEMHFATVGALILSTGLLLGGLLLSTDYALMHLASMVLDLTVAGLASGRALLPVPGDGRHAKAPSASRATAEPAVRGRRAAVEEDAEEENEEFDVEEAWDQDAQDEADDEAGQEAGTEEPIVRSPSQNATETAEQEADGPRVRNRSSKSDRQKVMQSLDEASLASDKQDYQLPSLDLLVEPDDICFESQSKEVRRKAKILERTFADFGFNVRVVEIETGPVIAQYEVELEAGLRLSRITGLADDLAIALRVPSVRIVAPIPGKNTVGIEVPNETRQVVRLREVMVQTNGKIKKMKVPLFLGKDVSGNPLTVDLATLPHLLIAGRTGTGKSVCLNAIISSILMTRRPDEVRMLMIDPKMVELSGYARLPHLMHPVVTDMRKAEAIFAWAVEKMEERYALLARTGVRHITSYNQLGKEELIERLQPECEEQSDAIPDHLPFIVIVADEIADLMMTAGKEVEQHIIRLAQKSRAVGIHLILATQKPTVDVITGLIKSNLPARISFQVASRIDSRVVLDEMGAEKLLGNGDMLFLWPGTSTLLRGQGTYLSDDEINAVVETVSTGEQNFVNELVNMKVESEEGTTDPNQLRKRDELYENAIDIVVREGRGSVSLLQRALGIGYGRAARLVDFMAEDGIVGEYNGSQAREVLLTIADWEKMQGQEPDPNLTPPPTPRRSNIVRPEPEEWESADLSHVARPTGKTLEEDDESADEVDDSQEDFQTLPTSRTRRVNLAAQEEGPDEEDEEEEYEDEEEEEDLDEDEEEEDLEEDEQENDQEEEEEEEDEEEEEEEYLDEDEEENDQEEEEEDDAEEEEELAPVPRRRRR